MPVVILLEADERLVKRLATKMHPTQVAAFVEIAKKTAEAAFCAALDSIVELYSENG